LYRIAKVISIADFLENVDALGILYFLCTAFYKAVLQMYTAIRVIRHELSAHKNHLPVYITAAIVYVLGLTISKSTTEHIYSALKIFPYTELAVYLALPSLLFLIIGFKKKVLHHQG
jgi:spore germination protein KB